MRPSGTDGTNVLYRFNCIIVGQSYISLMIFDTDFVLSLVLTVPSLSSLKYSVEWEIPLLPNPTFMVFQPFYVHCCIKHCTEKKLVNSFHIAKIC